MSKALVTLYERREQQARIEQTLCGAKRRAAKGVGLARLEFIVSNFVRVHPMALVEPRRIADLAVRREIEELTRGYGDPADYFVDTLALGVAKLAAPFHPHPVIVRLSDFKTNEYAGLLGGAAFEPKEENPMLGWRGASRYYDERYRAGFALECRALRKVRTEIGFVNVIIMVSFCRTPEEADRVLVIMAENNFKCGEDRRGRIPDSVSIHDRPPEIDERLVPRHWEGDLIKGARNASAVGTPEQRTTLFTVLSRMDDGSAEAALSGFSFVLNRIDAQKRLSLPYDQGREMSAHQQLTETTGVRVYFADPHSPWQRGINENTNGLLRQYLSKGTDLSGFTQKELDAIAWELNTRPRKSLGFRCPAELFTPDAFDFKTHRASLFALGH